MELPPPPVIATLLFGPITAIDFILLISIGSIEFSFFNKTIPSFATFKARFI